jgi:hypothetical protein
MEKTYVQNIKQQTLFVKGKRSRKGQKSKVRKSVVKKDRDGEHHLLRGGETGGFKLFKQLDDHHN